MSDDFSSILQSNKRIKDENKEKELKTQKIDNNAKSFFSFLMVLIKSSLIDQVKEGRFSQTDNQSEIKVRFIFTVGRWGYDAAGDQSYYPPLCTVVIDPNDCNSPYAYKFRIYSREYCEYKGDMKIEGLTLSDYIAKHPGDAYIDSLWNSKETWWIKGIDFPTEDWICCTRVVGYDLDVSSVFDKMVKRKRTIRSIKHEYDSSKGDTIIGIARAELGSSLKNIEINPYIKYPYKDRVGFSCDLTIIF